MAMLSAPCSLDKKAAIRFKKIKNLKTEITFAPAGDGTKFEKKTSSGKFSINSTNCAENAKLVALPTLKKPAREELI